MRRRTALAFGATFLALPWPGHSQAVTKLLVGWLHSGSSAAAHAHVSAFLAGMRERGYVRDKDFSLEVRFAGGKADHYPELARGLVRLRPHVLLGFETTARALRLVTETIPIVLTTSIDPVAAGLVKSLARPDTNVTGMVGQFDELTAKHVELLVELSPKLRRFALLNDRDWSAHDSYERSARDAAAAKGLELTVASVGNKPEVMQAFANFKRSKSQGVIVAAGGGVMITESKEILDSVRHLRLPAIYGLAFYPATGGLLSYGPNLIESTREAADFVVRIFQGAKPSDLPLRRTRKFDLVVNLKAAREIGVTVPQSILLRADRVIE